MTIRAVLFDLGGTLLAEDGYDFEAAVGAALALPPLRSEAGRRGDWAADLADWVHAIQRDGHAQHPDHDLCAWVRRRAGHFGMHAGTHALETLKDDVLEDALWDAGVRMSPIDGAQRALDAVAESRLRSAALSNTVFSARRMQRALEDAGLHTRFEFLLSSAELGTAKPDPRAFREALERLGLEGPQVLYVGDSWTNDVRGAHGAGLRACWISGAAPPDATPCVRLPNVAALGSFLGTLPEGGLS